MFHKYLLLFYFTFGFTEIYAVETASVLPKKIVRARLVNVYSNDVQYNYNNDGQLSGLSQGLNQSLDMRSFAKMNNDLGKLYNALNSLESGLGDELINSQIYSDTQMQVHQALVAAEYGISKKITLGLRVPVVRRRLKTSFEVQTINNAKAISQKLGSGISPDLKAGLGKVAATNFDGDFFAAAALESKGYQRPESFDKTDLGDIEVGLKHRFYSTPSRDMSYQIGLRLPTGNTGEIDNLFDSGTGGGNWALGALFFHDYKLNKNITFGLMTKAVYNLPDTRKRAVPRDEDDSLPSLLAEDGQVRDVTRRQSIDFESEISSTYTFDSGEWEIWGAYQYNESAKDHFEDSSENDPSLYYQGLSEGTDFKELSAEVGLTYSTIPAFVAKKFFAPMQIDALYNTRINGTNTSKASYVRVDAKVYF
ncbi:MAG: hypothetical protein CL674_04770 [Bdellovibrionaceae bacterium]|nr:hypothetical protein [Pseudobdellovibrionaceae bacterium]